MTDAERMLLSDAIQTSFEAERRAIKWRRRCIVAMGLFVVALFVR